MFDFASMIPDSIKDSLRDTKQKIDAMSESYQEILKTVDTIARAILELNGIFEKKMTDLSNQLKNLKKQKEAQ